MNDKPKRICGYKWQGTYGLTAICTLEKGHASNRHSGEIMDKVAFERERKLYFEKEGTQI